MATKILILIKKGKENMSILSGYSKVKDRILTSSGYKLLSRWTSSNTVDFDDGKTAQTKLGAINGIVKDASSLSTVTDPTFAAGAVAVKDALAEVTSNLTKTNETVSSYFKTYTVGSGTGSELTDCNDLPLYSIGYVYPTAKNNAFSTSNMVFTIGTILSSIVYKVQFAISSDDGSLKTRYKSSSGWTAWKAS